MSNIIVKTFEKNGLKASIYSREYNGKQYYDVKISKPFTDRNGQPGEGSRFNTWSELDTVLYLAFQVKDWCSEKNKPSKRADTQTYAPKHVAKKASPTEEEDISSDLASLGIDLDNI